MARGRNVSPKKPANPLSYPKSKAPYSPELFKNPSSEYRGCPFWAWNTKLSKAQLLRQIDCFQAMGMGGFHMHARAGLDTEYMGEDFMNMVRACVEYAESKNMLACLYDEDRWPSGTTGGTVTRDNPEYEQKHVKFTPYRYDTIPASKRQTDSSPSYNTLYWHTYSTLPEDGEVRPGSGIQTEYPKLLAIYDIKLNENGFLKSSHRLKEGQSGENLWYAYVESTGDSPWFNGHPYVDTLSKAAMARFIETTHEVYRAKVGDKFGWAVPCIFTDEPQFATLFQLPNPNAISDAYIPWTNDLPQSFQKQYSVDILDSLPQLFWDLPNGEPSLTRYRWHDHNCERFVSAFMDQIGQWCRENGIFLTGHMMEEPFLWSQTHSIGEAMRCYRNMDMPGMDLLMDQVEYNTAKQVTSVARQNGASGAMTEIYGVTHWYFTFEGHKGCGDWQAALGITFRVHHLALVSMAGESKRDYPASIGYQSPWYQEYGYIEDYFARVNVVLTRGEAITRVGVIHPIESYWLSWGPNGMGDERDRREQTFAELTSWLLHGLIDFDFISESILPNQVGKHINGKKLLVGRCKYDVIILPNLRTIRLTTLRILQRFTKAGGKVIIAGNAPTLVDAKVPQSNPVIEHSQKVSWSQQSILCALDVYRDIRVTYEAGSATNTLLYQMRQDGGQRFVFICNTDRKFPIETTIHLKGLWQTDLMDTITGEECRLQTQVSGEWTNIQYKFEGCASLLLRLTPRPDSINTSQLPQITYNQDISGTGKLTLDSIELSEPNVLVLDYAAFKVASGKWSGVSEILQLDNVIRGQLHLPYKGQVWKQPWAIPESERDPVTTITIQFTFESAFSISATTMLALEDAAGKLIYVNDTFLPQDPASQGWWVDEAINTVPLPGNLIKEGTNTITLAFPFGLLTNLERIYLLGDFAVNFQDDRTTLLQPLNLNMLGWGDITSQGLPFYAGNITYKCTLFIQSDFLADSSTTSLAISIPQFSSPVLSVTDLETNKKLGNIAFQPYMLPLGQYMPGEHGIAVKAFGNRYNSFGHFHLADGKTNLCGPDMWRTQGDWWTNNYNVMPMGVLECPQILVGQVKAVNDAVEDEVEDDVVDDLTVKEVYGGWLKISMVLPEDRMGEDGC